MTYIEMCFKIKELLFLINNDLEYYKSLIIYYNLVLHEENIRGDIESIQKEITEYLLSLVQDIEKELIILTKMDEYIMTIVENYTEVFFEGSEEYHLFEHFIKRINNSWMMRTKNAFYVINNYNKLITYNGFTNNNYKILKNQSYISEKEYTSMLSIF